MPSTAPRPTTVKQSYELVLDEIPTQVYIPAGIAPGSEVQVMIALHGIRGTGQGIIQGLAEYADQYRWLILAPTLSYNGDYLNPAILTEEDPMLAGRINRIVDAAPAMMDLKFKPQLLVYGFSRGAQLAHRYAIFYPKRVLAVSAASAGSYTLPFAQLQNPRSGLTNDWLLPGRPNSLPFPYGVSNLARYTGHDFSPALFSRVNFWLEVGGRDNNPADVSRSFDQYEGMNRVERARGFYSALKDLGLNVTLTVFPGAAHEVTPDMRYQACKFFESLIEVAQTDH